MNNYDKECILRALMSYRRDLYELLKKYNFRHDSYKSEYLHVDMLHKKIYQEIYPETKELDSSQEV